MPILHRSKQIPLFLKHHQGIWRGGEPPPKPNRYLNKTHIFDFKIKYLVVIFENTSHFLAILSSNNKNDFQIEDKFFKSLTIKSKIKVETNYSDDQSAISFSSKFKPVNFTQVIDNMEEQKRLLALAHEQGHYGAKIMERYIKHLGCEWTNLRKDCQEIVAKCNRCIKNNIRQKGYSHMH